MQLSRRGFLKLTGAGVIATTLTKLGVSVTGCQTYTAGPELRIKYAKETSTICPYCGSGCGQVVSVVDGKIVNIEGDPDHPINQGALCSKGNSLYQIAVNPQRLTKVLYRAPGGSAWEEKELDWAIDRIAQNIKATRDANWIDKEDGIPVNRTEAIANFGGAALDNEECYLLTKFARSLGIVYLEHQARI